MDLAASHSDVPYEQRWELLKPAIIKIYLEERVTLPRLAERVANDYGFKAETHQYRYRLKNWGIKKRTTTVEKDAVITALGKRRRRHDIGTSDVKLQQGDGLKPVDKKQLKRYINDSIRNERPPSIRPGLFLSRTLPSSALFEKLGGHDHDNPSPLSSGPRTPAYLTVSSPQDHYTAASPQEGMSPTTQLVQQKIMVDRARLLLDGRDLDLMKQMSKDERRVTADWLHDFWMFSFVTTKYWGKGPKHWTLPLIRFKTLAGFIDGSSGNQQSRSQELDFIQSPSTARDVIDTPTQLCNWSIHIDDDIDYEPINSQPTSPTSEDDDQFDIENESTWREWDAQNGRDLTSTITEGLEANAFTNHQAEDVPLAIDQIVNTVSGSIKDAKVEAIGFAIMTRNFNALTQLLSKRDFEPEALRSISPFHMAAKFLDGSKACCRVMEELLFRLEDETSIGVNYIDNLGLTVLDTLFMSILRSHSSVSPAVLGSVLSAPGLNFGGVDVDVCGRWDADSPCVRQLHATGATAIPHEWKHMFCHTSAQAVCHCLTFMFREEWSPNINTTSGLFQRRCQSCGSDLKIGPLHALVVVCFHLASAGRPGETLFGMLACLVCLLTFNADPLLSAEISLPAILRLGETEECQHQSFTAAELASAVPSVIVNAWTPEVKLGWKAIKEVLNHCARARQRQTMISMKTNASFELPATQSSVEYNYEEYNGRVSDSESNCEVCQYILHHRESHEKRLYIKCGHKRLGIIWAAVQVELLNYRRLEVGGSWLSSEFDIHDVVEGLHAGDDSILMRLVKNRGEEALKEFSTCGLFLGADDCARREQACATYFSNLDDWKRTTFLVPFEA